MIFIKILNRNGRFKLVSTKTFSFRNYSNWLFVSGIISSTVFNCRGFSFGGVIMKFQKIIILSLVLFGFGLVHADELDMEKRTYAGRVDSFMKIIEENKLHILQQNLDLLEAIAEEGVKAEKVTAFILGSRFFYDSLFYKAIVGGHRFAVRMLLSKLFELKKIEVLRDRKNYLNKTLLQVVRLSANVVQSSNVSPEDVLVLVQEVEDYLNDPLSSRQP